MDIETTEPTLLIADDNAGVRRVLVQMLASIGISTITAADGTEALASARRFLPDLIILDVRMPGVDGHGVCAELRRDESTRRIPILMLTGLGGAEDEIRGLDGGADDYVAKPFRFDDLQSRVRALLARCAR